MTNRQRSAWGTCLLAGLVCLLTAGSTLAQPSAYPRLGLSAAPDAYVPTIEISSTEPFDLYVIAMGPDGGDGLPFDIASMNWAVFAPCCGASYTILAAEMNPQMVHQGIPFSGVVSSSEVCMEDDFVLLATLTFDLWVEFPGEYLLPAGTIGPAVDCDTNEHFLFDLTVTGIVDGGATPASQSSWGSMKTMYR